MDYKIAIISPSVTFSKTAKSILKKKRLLIPIYIATGQETLDTADRLIEEGVKIIISRGRNVLLLREHVSIPILNVNYTYEDMFYSYQKAKKYSEKIAFMGFDLARDAAIRFREISGAALVIPPINFVDEIDGIVADIKERGIGVLIGGHTTQESAKKWGIACVETAVDGNAIEAVVNEALHLRHIEVEKQRTQSILHEILQSTNSGIIAVDEECQILFTNMLAKRLLESKEAEFIKFCFSNNTLFDKLSQNNSMHNYIAEFKNEKFSLDLIPIFINKHFCAIVVNIRNMDMIFSSEKEIRKKVIVKSHRAKKQFADILGSSKLMNEVIVRAKKYAKVDSTILITGESGTGKEVFAQSIHNYSKRSQEAFVAVNCAAIPENILESELFGYVKGAFTGARTEGKEGLFELAHRGTIFLDEIGEISLQVQVKLLRVLQEREITRLGDTKTMPIDVRVIVATNKDLAMQIKKKKFREDLFYRLSVLPLHLPSLRERKEDIIVLVQSILNEYDQMIQLSSNAQKILCEYDFPGNIRQLRNIIERLVVMADDNFIDDTLIRGGLEAEPDFLQRESEKKTTDLSSIRGKSSVYIETAGVEQNQIATYTKELILDCLEKNGGNKAAVARELGLSKTTLWRKLRQYGL